MRDSTFGTSSSDLRSRFDKKRAISRHTSAEKRGGQSGSLRSYVGDERT